jgi:Phage tail assembly chaperone proteins, E, or 41 or 14
MDDKTRKIESEEQLTKRVPHEEVDYATSGETPSPEQLDQESNFQHTLDKPIDAHGEKVFELRWREPTGGDIETAGIPIKMDFFSEKPSITFDERKMSAMISVLCKVPPSSVKQLTAGDWQAVAWKLTRFFMPRLVN